MIAGTNAFRTLGDQMALDTRILDQATGCALKSWRSLYQGKESTSSFSNIKQKPEEPYEDFVAWLMEGIHRVISSNEAADILIKQLAFENANSTCQAILHPIKKIWNTVRFHQAMCRCRASNDAGCCHSSGHKRRFSSASSSIFSYREEFQ